MSALHRMKSASQTQFYPSLLRCRQGTKNSRRNQWKSLEINGDIQQETQQNLDLYKEDTQGLQFFALDTIDTFS